MSNRGMAQHGRRGRARGAGSLARTSLALTLGLCASTQAVADVTQGTPEGAVRAAYAELGGLLFAPKSKERDEEIAQLLGRNVDFEEMTRRAFGEPCPRAKCTDHWAELSPAQQKEVEPLFAAVVTGQWTRELGKAFGYEIDVQPAVTHGRDTRVRVLARPKSDPSKAPIVVDAIFLANHPPYRLVDLDADRSKFVRNYFKQFDHTLTSPGEGYATLVARLRRKVDRGTTPRDSDADADADADAAADADRDAPPPSDTPSSREPAPKPPPPGFPWLPFAVGGLVTLAIGLWLGRRSR